MNNSTDDMDVLNWAATLNAEYNWDGAKCLNRPDEFCPKEEIMTDEKWTKQVAPDRAKECLKCPAFEQCKQFLLEQLEAEDLSPTGIMAGVVLVQKSQKQILNALAKVEKVRASSPTQ